MDPLLRSQNRLGPRQRRAGVGKKSDKVWTPDEDIPGSSLRYEEKCNGMDMSGHSENDRPLAA